MYKVIISPKFEKSFRRLPKEIQEIGKKKLKILETKLIGEPLKHKLKNFFQYIFIVINTE